MGADKSAFKSPLMPNEIRCGLPWSSRDDHKVNYEAKDEYEITIVASDDSTPEGIGMVDVTITVVNAEDDGRGDADAA